MKFDDWFWEMESFHVRAERFWDDVDNKRKQEIYEWLKSAYELGYEEGKNDYETVREESKGRYGETE